MSNSKKHENETSADDFQMFRDQFKDISPIKQDKIPPQPASGKQKSAISEKNTEARNRLQDNKTRRQAAASFHFSDGFEAHFDQQGPLKYTKPGEDTYEVKRLRRGEYPPDLILDLHGIKREDAKLELAALILEAQKQHAHCVCVVHGIGNHILKQAVPSWLVQHPAVLGFHQAPLEWGGQGALLVLIEH